jgi:RNA polymerase sigma factor for flagellar operon FliA
MDRSRPSLVEEERLVRDNLPLVHYLVAEAAHRIPAHVHRDDLESAAMAGLAQAARSYDADRGVPFDRYASRRIRGALLDELRSRDWASRSVRASARAVHRATDDLTAQLGRQVTDAEVAQHLDCDRATVDAVRAGIQRANIVNYDSVFADGSAEDLLPQADELGPDALLLEQERQAYLVDAVAALPERLRRVVVGYFLEERSMHDLGQELGVTDSRISQMRAEALGLLKEGLQTSLQAEQDEIAAQRRGGRVARRKDAYFAAIVNRRGARERMAGPASLAELATA